MRKGSAKDKARIVLELVSGPGVGGPKKSLRTLPAKERRRLEMALGEAYPLRLLCRLLEVPRSSLYYRPKGLGEEERLCARLRELAGTWPRYGYRRLGALLREEGLLLPRHPPKLKTSFPQGKG